MLGRSMSRLSMPRRRQRLAYEGNGDATAPLRSPSRPAPSKVKVALKTTLLAGVLVASASGVFLGAQHFLPAGGYRSSAGRRAGRGDGSAACCSKRGGRAGPRCGRRNDLGTAPKRESRGRPGSCRRRCASPGSADARSDPGAHPEPLRKSNALALPRDEVEGYLARGEQLLKTGDVATARLFFARAARPGKRAARSPWPGVRPGIPAHAPNLRHTAQSGGGGALARQGEEPGNDRPGKVKMC